MRRILLVVLAAIWAPVGLSADQPNDSAAKRALEFAELFGSHSREPVWKERYLPDYWHPMGNDSGLPGRPPAFLPPVATPPGDYLYTKVRVGRVVRGYTPWLLDGKAEVVLVELLFTAVAQLDGRVGLYSQPKELAQFSAMAVDSADGRWKYLDSYPNTASFYHIPYFLEAWERIKGKGSIKNIAEVRDRLLALADQRTP